MRSRKDEGLQVISADGPAIVERRQSNRRKIKIVEQIAEIRPSQEYFLYFTSKTADFILLLHPIRINRMCQPQLQEKSSAVKSLQTSPRITPKSNFESKASIFPCTKNPTKDEVEHGMNKVEEYTRPLPHPSHSHSHSSSILSICHSTPKRHQQRTTQKNTEGSANARSSGSRPGH